MNDCSNADVRDLLPDLMHERLDAESRAKVEMHVSRCADCAAELDLLRQMRAARLTPRVDVASIVAALPAYRAPARRLWIGWRAAAAITVMVAGASSVAVLQRGASTSIGRGTDAPMSAIAARVMHDSSKAQPVVPSAAVPPHSTVGRSPAVANASTPPHASQVGGAERELAMGGGAMGDLNDRELASLLKDIESLDAVPSVEVETSAMSPIAPAGRSMP